MEPFQPPSIPTAISHVPIVEEAIPASNLFLLRRANRAFVQGANAYPTLEEPFVFTRRQWLGVGGLGGIGLLLAFGVAIPLGIVVTVGLLWLLGMVMYGHIYRQTKAVAHQNGWILSGEVLHAEMIRARKGGSRRQRIGIKYRFVAPGGIWYEGYAEADQDGASHAMPPSRETPLYIWYDEQGNHYLL